MAKTDPPTPHFAETPELMPITLMLSHKLNKKMADLRRSGELGWLRPDSKTQVTVEYEKKANGAFVPRRVDTVVISTQHAEEISTADLQKELMEKVVKTVIPANLLDDKTVFHIQPSGRFVIGGPQGDAGLTGRKIIVDSYGGHGGEYRDPFPRSYGLRRLLEGLRRPESGFSVQFAYLPLCFLRSSRRWCFLWKGLVQCVYLTI